MAKVDAKQEHPWLLARLRDLRLDAERYKRTATAQEWDGDLHPTIEQGRAELRNADGDQGEGLFAVLVECVKVPAEAAQTTHNDDPDEQDKDA